MEKIIVSMKSRYTSDKGLKEEDKQSSKLQAI